MAIQLEGYNTVFANAVYARKEDEFLALPTNQKILAVRHIVVINRGTEPDKESVLDYLQQKAAESKKSVIILSGVAKEGETLTEALVRKVRNNAPHFIDDIARGNEDLLGIFAEHITAPSRKEETTPKNSVRVKYGTLFVEELSLNYSRGVIKDPKWYEAALSHPVMKTRGLGERWFIRISLENDNMPKYRNDLDTLINHGVKKSDALDIIRYAPTTPEELKRFLTTIYTGLTTAEQIRELNDETPELLDKEAAKSFTEVIEQLQKNQAEMIAQAIALGQLRQKSSEDDATGRKGIIH